MPPFGVPNQPPRLPMMAPVRDAEEHLATEKSFYIDPWIGWRSWNVILIKDEALLRSITYKTIWKPGTELVAHCMKSVTNDKEYWENGHESPDKAHGCGVYAVKTEEDAARWLNFSPESRMRVMGEVKLWGTVFRYTRGYLSEYAYPKSIFVPHDIPEQFPIDSRELVHELRKSYRGVEVRLL